VISIDDVERAAQTIAGRLHRTPLLRSATLSDRLGVDADYVIFGPVWASASHPASMAAGIEALATVAHALRIPVLAIGGVTEQRIAECRAAGAAGYAAIGLFE